jgi:raffinose/stachyose/melibiose transport system substrate-binding protein
MFSARSDRWTVALAAALGIAAPGSASAQTDQTTLTIESWRSADTAVWSDVIIPAFKAVHAEIDVVFKPSVPTEYNAALRSRLQDGTAGDLITCRPFDAALDLFQQGHLAAVNDIAGMANFSEVAKSAWTTDDGATIYCVPMASVIHGFVYNKRIFEELGLAPPKTTDEFFALLDKIKENATYAPLDLGTADQWESATMGFQNIGPNHWKGEEGRKALIAGTARFTDKPYVDTWAELAKWAPYLPENYQQQRYPDSQSMFTLGQAAIYPAGSWDIKTFEAQGEFEFGAFPPPVGKTGDTCFISDHPDTGIGLNAKSPNQDAAKVFLSWVASPEFAEIYANAIPGFFPLSSVPVEISNPVAQEFVGWRETCQSTIRNSYQILSRGTPNLENELWNVTAQVINGTLKAEDAAKQIQAGLDSWYTPVR